MKHLLITAAMTTTNSSNDMAEIFADIFERSKEILQTTFKDVVSVDDTTTSSST